MLFVSSSRKPRSSSIRESDRLHSFCLRWQRSRRLRLPSQYEWGLLRRKTVQAYRRLVETEDGEIILRDLARFCRIYDDVADPNSTEKTYYALGQQRVYRRILAMTGKRLDDVRDMLNHEEEYNRE